MVLSRSAYFELCEHRISGRIVTVSNGPTVNFYSKDEGLDALDQGVEAGYIMPDEARIVRQQIEDSCLPARTPRVVQLAMAMAAQAIAAAEEILDEEDDGDDDIDESDTDKPDRVN